MKNFMLGLIERFNAVLLTFNPESRKWFIALFFAWTGLGLALLELLSFEYVTLAGAVIAMYSKFNVDEKKIKAVDSPPKEE